MLVQNGNAAVFCHVLAKSEDSEVALILQNALAETIKEMVKAGALDEDFSDLAERLEAWHESPEMVNRAPRDQRAHFDAHRAENAQLVYEAMTVLTNVTRWMPEPTEIKAPDLDPTTRFSNRFCWADFWLLVRDYKVVHPDREDEMVSTVARVRHGSEGVRDETLISLNRILGYPLGYLE